MTSGPFKRLLPPAIAFAAVALVALLLAHAAFDPAYNPHAHFRANGMCPKCHLYAKGQRIPDRFTGASTDYCFGCHSKDALGRSHPIGTRPRDRFRKSRVPDGFVLDDDGRTMCLTCHNAHGPFVATVKTFDAQKPENPDAQGGTPFYYRTRFLRRTDPVRGYSVLCDGCHDKP